jgi:hypothetical protein
VHVKDVLDTDDFTPDSRLSDLEKISDKEDSDPSGLGRQPTLGFLEKSRSSHAPSRIKYPPPALFKPRRSVVLDIRGPSQGTADSGILHPRDKVGRSTVSSGTLHSFLEIEPTSPSSPPSLTVQSLRHSQSFSSPTSEFTSLRTPSTDLDYILPPLSPVSTFGFFTRSPSMKSISRKPSQRLSSVPGLRGLSSRWSSETSLASKWTPSSSHWEDEEAPPVPELPDFRRMLSRKSSRSRKRRPVT